MAHHLTMQARPESLPAEKPRPERLPSLDGMRAVAILMVLASHCQYAAGFPTGRFRPALVFLDGELGVRIFFVISGFIITRLLLDEEALHAGISLRRFYLRRALRILPIYGAYLGVLVLLSLAGRYSESPSGWIGCLTFTRNLMGRGDSATEHFWSLAVEEQFYLCWPLLFAALDLGRRRRRARTILLVLALASVALRILVPATAGTELVARLVGHRSLLRYADSIALGCAGAYLHGRFAVRRPGIAALLALLLLAGVQACAAESPLPGAVRAVVPAIQAATVAFLVLCLVRPARGAVFSVLNCGIMVRIGVLSYSLYVWHFVFLSAFAPRAIPWPWLQHWTIWWIPAAVTAALSHEFLEQPFVRLRRRFRRTASDVPL